MCWCVVLVGLGWLVCWFFFVVFVLLFGLVCRVCWFFFVVLCFFVCCFVFVVFLCVLVGFGVFCGVL